MPRTLRLIAFLLGVALIVGARYTMAYPDSTAGAIAGVLGPQAGLSHQHMREALPFGIGVGVIPLMLGALLVALVIGLPPAPATETGPALGSTRGRPSLRRRARLLTAVALALAAIATALLLQNQPGKLAVAAWAAGMLAGFLAAVCFDRARGTHFGNLFPQRCEWAAMLLLVAADLVLVGHDLHDWHWAGTPDEAAFFLGAKGFAEGKINTFVLSEEGVFAYHPVLSSYYQAVFMLVFGMDAFGWRLSSAVALACSLPFTYLVMRELYGRRAGWFAATLLGCAQLAVGYAHMGYNNAQVYLPVTAALGVFAWALRRRSVAGYYLAGWLVGASFFTYFTARLSLALVPLLAWALGGLRRLREDRPAMLAVLGGFLLTALPTLLHVDKTLAQMLRLTGATDGKLVGVAHFGEVVPRFFAPAARARIAAHWLLSVFHWLGSETGHFQLAPVVDPVSVAAAAVALWLGAGALLRRRRDFLCPAYMFSAFAVGALSAYGHPALTRLLFLAPLTAMLAAMALDQLVRRIPKSAPAGLIGGALLATAVAWNLAALHHNVYHEFHGYADGTNTELLRIAQRLPADCRIVYIQRPDTYMVGSAPSVLAQYKMDDRLTYLRPLTAETKQVLDTLAPPFVVAYDLTNLQDRRALEATLIERFPKVVWRDSDPDRSWNMRYFYVPQS